MFLTRSAQALHFAGLDETERVFRTTLLPQGYPEGRPLHPAYPGGHGTVAGACATILKALFQEDQPVPDVVLPAEDGTKLEARADLGLTVGGELNKLAYNIAVGRTFSGIHYRSDSVQGMLLGERVAVTLPEDFPGYAFTGFGGERITIVKRG